MLFTIDKGNVPDCRHRQQDIVHFMTTVEIVIKSEIPYVFYDYNATLGIATCYSDVKDLDKINWDLLYEDPRLDGYCRLRHSVLSEPKYSLRQETRQAEFLIYKSIPLKTMVMVGTYDNAKAEKVRTILEGAGVELPVEAKPAWYF